MGIGSDQYGSMLIPIIMLKLPGDVRLRIAKESREDVWNLDELMGVISTEVEAQEASDGVRMNSVRSSQQQQCKPVPSSGTNSTASVLTASNMKIQCFFAMYGGFERVPKGHPSYYVSLNVGRTSLGSCLNTLALIILRHSFCHELAKWKIKTPQS